MSGASSGIGAALALHLSSSCPGITLTLVARDAGRLAATAAAARAKGAKVRMGPWGGGESGRG